MRPRARFLPAATPIALCTLALALPPAPAPAPTPWPASLSPWRGQPYLGLVLREDPAPSDQAPPRTFIDRLLPGPLTPTTQTVTKPPTTPTLPQHSPTSAPPEVRVGDELLAINGSPASASLLAATLQDRRPGDTITLTLRRDGLDRNVPVTLADRDLWSGTLGRGSLRSIPDAPAGRVESLAQQESDALDAYSGEGNLQSLLFGLIGVQNNQLDPLALPAIVQSFRRPLSPDAAERPVFDQVPAALRDAPGLTSLIAAALGIPEPREAVMDWNIRLDYMDSNPPAMRRGSPGLAGRSRALVLQLAKTGTIEGPDAPAHLDVLREAIDVAPKALNDDLMRLRRVVADLEEHFDDVIPRPPYAGEPLKGIVTGEIHEYQVLQSDLVVVWGGAGPNTYDMSKVFAVLDLGGDDTYDWSTASPERETSLMQVVVDLHGNDRYIGGSFAGPGVGILGLNIVDDRAGNDIYEAKGPMSIAAGLFGTGVLIDSAGDDSYLALGPDTVWSLGAGLYGAGVLIDREGNDVYKGERLSVGVAGPFGFGAVVDAAGNDRVSASARSIGFGTGIPDFAAGGLGAFYDLAGDDLYQGGQHTLASGMHFGMGVLHDAGGQDTYTAKGDSFASSSHRGVAFLSDEQGNDTYTADGPRTLAFAADQSIALLIENSGQDTYTATDATLASSSDQSLAVLLEVAGNDTYTTTSAKALGTSGPSTLHFAQTGLFTFSFFMDAQGDDQVIGTPFAPRIAQKTGAPDATNPPAGTAWGVRIDR